ncbi:MAG: hypothetical protein EAZ42_08205, partial [Verrucomicrobia bacterium]
MLFRGDFSKQLLSGFLTAALLLCVTVGEAQQAGIVFTLGGTQGPEIEPSWWKARRVLDPDAAPANRSVVNVGQLKWITRQLHEELSALLPNEANLFPLNAAIPSSPNALERVMPHDPNYINWKASNSSVATLGQLKNSAVKFYDALFNISPAWLTDQLNRSGHPNDGRKYPWTNVTTDDANRSPANIGQLKSVFALRLRESLDDDLLPDIFELALIKYVPAFAGKTLNDITWKPGDAVISLKGPNNTTTPTTTLVPNLNGSKNGIISASSLLAEHQPVGSVGGSFSVGGDGSANYSIPINIPKGTSGVEPQIAITYSSGAGNGALGVGFDISGFQRITRGATDRLKDGFTDPVDFDIYDRFFLDGELLIATQNASGTAATVTDYGKAGTVYQTENNSFARIISHGQTGSGPAYWTVQTKAGLTIELGKSESSNVSKGELAGKGTLVWNVNKVSDNVGNYYTVSYQFDHANSGPLDYRLAQVHYTGNGSSNPYNEVHFLWEDRPDVAAGFVHGVKVDNRRRLQRIEIKTQGRTLYYYELGYTKNLANNASQLTTLTRCIDANNKMPPTKFNWAREALPNPDKWSYFPQNAQNTYSVTTQHSGRGNQVSVETRINTYDPHNFFTGVDRISGSQVNGFIDFNGDGLLDRVSEYDYGLTRSEFDRESGGLWVALNTGNGFAKASNWFNGAKNAYLQNRVIVGRMGATQTITQTHQDPQYYFVAPYLTGRDSGSQVNGFIDLNGDGLVDRVSSYNYQDIPELINISKNGGLWVSINTGNGFLKATNWQKEISNNKEDNYFSWVHDGSKINAFVDLNGDSLPDRVSYRNHVTGEIGLWVSLNTGSGFQPAKKWWASTKEEDNYPEWGDKDGNQFNGFIDLNGDGLLDRVCHRKYIANGAEGELGLWVYLNNGNGFDSAASPWWSSKKEEDNYLEWKYEGSQINGFYDLNGDGLLDRVCHRKYLENGANGELGLWVSLNTGKGFDAATSWWSSTEEKDNYLVWEYKGGRGDNGKNNGSKLNGFYDLNGDGLLDRVCHRKYLTNGADGGSGLWVSLNNGSSFDVATKWYSSTDYRDCFPDWYYEGSTLSGFMDFNGDGLLDRMAHYNYNGPEKSYGLWVSLNTGNGFSDAQKWYNSTTYHSNNFPSWVSEGSYVNGFLDLNGDGLVDRLQNSFFDRNNVEFNTGSPFSSDLLPQDLGPRITSIVDGLGAEIKVEYKRGSLPELDDAGRRIYTPAAYNATEAAARIHAVNGAGYLVSRYAEQNGLGGYRWKCQYYGERKVDGANNVDLGFKWIESIDEQSQAGSVTVYSQAFPYQGKPLESISYLKDSSGNFILTSKENYAYEKHSDIPGVGGKIRFSYQSSTTSASCVPEGPHAVTGTLATNISGSRSYLANILSTATHRNNAFDSFGNLLATTTTSSDGFTTSSSNTYASPVSDLGRWIHGRLSSATVTKTGPAGYTPITKTSTFTYYTDGPFVGMLKTEIAEPTNASAVEKSYTYDQWGNKASTTIRALNGDQPPRTSYVKYDATGRFPVEEWNDLGHKSTHFYDNTRSLHLASTGPNGLTTRYFYDAWGTRILTRGPDGSEVAEITRYAKPSDVPDGTYLDRQSIIFIRKTQGTGAAATTAYLDAQGRVLMSSAESFDGRLVFSRTDYDVRGRNFRQSQPFFLGVDGRTDIRWSSVEFDFADRPWKNISPDGSFSTVSFQGFTTVATNSLGRKQTRIVNAQGWLTSALDNDGNAITYTYSVDGKPKSTIAPGSRPITTNLDIFGQKTSMTDPNVGTSSTEYYSFGEVKKSTDAKGATTEATYDILGRQKTRILKNPGGSLDSTTTWTYDTAPGAGLGQIHKVEMKNASGTTTYLSSIRYDSLGRPTETITTQHGETFRTAVTHDTQGRPLTETDAGGLTILHEYNARGFKIGIRDYFTGQLYWKPLEYDASGRLIREELGNGVVNTNSYDQKRGFLLGNQALKNGTVLQNMSYEWHNDGTLKKRADLRASLSEDFIYDSLNRLTSSQVFSMVFRPDKPGEPRFVPNQSPLSYAYATNGNITSKAKVGTYSYDSAARPHAVTSIAAPNGTTRAFEYDANGAFTIERRNGQQYREVVWAAHEDVKEFRLNAGPRVLKIDGTELYAAGRTTTTFEYDAGFARSKKITERDRLQREVTLYLGSYERITTESRASENLSYTLQKTEHRHSIGGLA